VFSHSRKTNQTNGKIIKGNSNLFISRAKNDYFMITFILYIKKPLCISFIFVEKNQCYLKWEKIRKGPHESFQHSSRANLWIHLFGQQKNLQRSVKMRIFKIIQDFFISKSSYIARLRQIKLALQVFPNEVFSYDVFPDTFSRFWNSFPNICIFFQIFLSIGVAMA